MKRLAVLLAGVLALGAPMLTAMPAGASRAAPSEQGAIQGTYNLYFDYGATGTYTEQTLTLYADHSGTGENGDLLKWKASHFKITLRFRNTSQHWHAHFRGKLQYPTGNFSSPTKPGTISDSNGQTGLAYAVKTS